MNEEIIQRLKITPAMLAAVTEEQERELLRREALYRGDKPPAEIEGKCVILIDDGLATGASMRAAIKALRTRRPDRIVVAVPIASAEVCRQLSDEADETVCARTPESFQAVGKWYADFTQVTDEEVRQLLQHAAHQRRARDIQAHRNLEFAPLEQADSPVTYYV